MLCAFAGLTILNLGLAKSPGDNDTTLDLISVMAKAYDEGEGEEYDCLQPMGDDEFFWCFGCRASWEDIKCIGKDGKTYTYAYKPEPA